HSLKPAPGNNVRENGRRGEESGMQMLVGAHVQNGRPIAVAIDASGNAVAVGRGQVRIVGVTPVNGGRRSLQPVIVIRRSDESWIPVDVAVSYHEVACSNQ